MSPNPEDAALKTAKFLPISQYAITCRASQLPWLKKSVRAKGWEPVYLRDLPPAAETLSPLTVLIRATENMPRHQRLFTTGI